MRPAQLVVFVDALGLEQATLLAEADLGLGESARLRGILGYSSGAIPTILTGVPPARHGRMCLFARAAGASPLAPLRWLGLLPRVVHERHRVRHWAAKLFAAAQGYGGYFAIHRVPPDVFAQLEAPEQEDIFRARAIGGVPTIFARAHDAGLNVTLTDWRAPEPARVQAIEASPDADLAFLYLSGLDGILHREGRMTQTARDWACLATGYIQRARRAMRARGREVEVLVVGDHGMAEVKQVVDPRPVVAQLRARDPRRFLFVDSTMLRADLGESPEETRAALAQLPGEILDSTALDARHAPADGRYGELMTLLPEGMIFAPSYVGGRVRGMHGYDLSSSSASAALLGDAPIPSDVMRLEDVSSLLTRRLGLGEAGGRA